MTSNGRLTQISKVQQLLVRSSLVFLNKPNSTNVSIEDNLQWMTTSNIKSEISQQNPSDLPQIGNVSSVDQTKLYKCSK